MITKYDDNRAANKGPQPPAVNRSTKSQCALRAAKSQNVLVLEWRDQLIQIRSYDCLQWSSCLEQRQSLCWHWSVQLVQAFPAVSLQLRTIGLWWYTSSGDASETAIRNPKCIWVDGHVATNLSDLLLCRFVTENTEKTSTVMRSNVSDSISKFVSVHSLWLGGLADLGTFVMRLACIVHNPPTPSAATPDY